MAQTHTHALMFICGLCCTLLIQTVGRVSFDGLSHAPLFRFCGMLMLGLFAGVFAVLWMWRIVFPRALRTVKMKWQVLLCFVPLVLPTIMSGVNAPIKVEDQFNGSASTAFKTWRVVFHVVWDVVLWVVVPVLYFVSVRTDDRFRFSKKMFTIFLFTSIGGSVAIVFAFFGDQTSIAIFVALGVFCWVLVLLLERRKIVSHKNDFSSVAVLSVMIIGLPVAFGIAVTTIFDGVEENSALQLLVRLIGLRVN